MNEVGQIERQTQNRLVKLFKDQLKYTYLGDWQDRSNNSNIEEGILSKCLKEKKGYSDTLISKALYELGKAANTVDTQELADTEEAYIQFHLPHTSFF